MKYFFLLLTIILFGCKGNEYVPSTYEPKALPTPLNASRLTFTSISDGGYINATSDSVNYSISGNCDVADETVTIRADGVTIGATTCNGATFSTTINSTTLTQAKHSFTAKIYTVLGETITSTAVDITRDITYPTVAITTPANNSYINIANDSTTFSVNGTCSENGQTVVIKVDGTAVTTTGGVCNGTNFTSTIDSTGYSDATYSFTAVISDVAGNTTTSNSKNIIKDTTLPTAPSGITLGATPNGLNSTPTISWTAATDTSGINFYEVTIYNNTSNVYEYAYTTLVSGDFFSGLALNNGDEYAMVVRAKDNAGNYGSGASSGFWYPELRYAISIAAFGNATAAASVGITCGVTSCSASGSWATATAGCTADCLSTDNVIITANTNGQALRYISRYRTDGVDTTLYSRLVDTQSISINKGIAAAVRNYTVEFLTQTKQAITISKTGDAAIDGTVLSISCASSGYTCSKILVADNTGSCTVNCINGENFTAQVDWHQNGDPLNLCNWLKAPDLLTDDTANWNNTMNLCSMSAPGNSVSSRNTATVTGDVTMTIDTLFDN